MRVDFYWHDYKYLPYEHKLANRELIGLMGQKPVSTNQGLSIVGTNGWKTKACRTTYFREAVADDGTRIVPLQAKLEASINSRQGHTLPYRDISVSLHRQSTRYSAHGIHEYRGKFNPQIVRAVGNILNLHTGDWVLDPFCGSGTTLLEAAHIGWNAIGIDLNPLAVQIAKAKIAAMHIPIEELEKQTSALKQNLYRKFWRISFSRPFTSHEIQLIGVEEWESYLPNLNYLRGWFTTSVLIQISSILNEIAQLPSSELRLIFQVILSDILRDVSLQEPADLRIRRRKSHQENMPAINLYVDAITAKSSAIFNARQHTNRAMKFQDAVMADARECSSIIRKHPMVGTKRKFDAVITSPPYASALPYIDTHRLSLAVLGLLSVGEIRETERNLIGNREISARERMEIEEAIESNSDNLPNECVLLCRKLRKSLDVKKDGFRRQNVPALIYTYFVDMSSMFKEMRQLLRPGAPFALIVGRNKTTLGERSWVIDTPRFLALLASHNDFSIQEILELETYQRFDIHQVNSIRSESLIIFRTPAL